MEVFRGVDGRVISHPTEIAREWQQLFFRESQSIGQVVDIACEATLHDEQRAMLAQSPMEWRDWVLELRKAPTPASRIASQNRRARARAHSVAGPNSRRFLREWRSHTHGQEDALYPFPRAHAPPLADTNARDILCETIPAKLVAKVARAHLVDAVKHIAGDSQLGARKGGRYRGHYGRGFLQQVEPASSSISRQPSTRPCPSSYQAPPSRQID